MKDWKESLKLWQSCLKSVEYKIAKNKTTFVREEAHDLFIEKLEENYFKCIGHGTYKLVFSKNSVDYVVKLYNSFIDDEIDSNYKFKSYWLQHLYSDKYISIQPKASRLKKGRMKAINYFHKKFGKPYCEVYDIHFENVGTFKGKPVIFDFMACSH